MGRGLALCLVLLVATGASASRKTGPPGTADPINKYSDLKSFGSVVVRCPIEKTWRTVGNAKTWFDAVIGDFLINNTVVLGNGRQLQSKFNYFVDPPQGGPIARTQQRLIKLSDFDYEHVTTFDSSTLPLGPWTTRVVLDRVTFIRRPVEYTLISFAQAGSINVPAEQQEMVQQMVQSFFVSVFAPSLKKKFDRCK